MLRRCINVSALVSGAQCLHLFAVQLPLWRIRYLLVLCTAPVPVSWLTLMRACAPACCVGLMPPPHTDAAPHLVETSKEGRCARSRVPVTRGLQLHQISDPGAAGSERLLTPASVKTEGKPR